MKPRILVVEDSAMNRELLCDWLESEGYQVAVATNLGEGFAALRGAPPAAVLLDVKLGPDDGVELVRWMRGQSALCQVPVIAVTAHALLAEQQRVLDGGCDACLPKPLDFAQLQEQLRRTMRSQP